MQGRFFTFEGVEACGKSTQAKLLAEWFRQNGRNVREVREPGGTPLGEKLRDLVKHDPAGVGMAPETELLLMNASRSELVRRVIAPALAAGEVVICDRFYDSTIAYQGWGRQMDLERVRAVIGVAVGEIKPDLTFFVSVSAGTSALRLAARRAREQSNQADRFELEKASFYDRVRAGYRWLIENEPGRIVEIDGNGSIYEVQALIVAAAKRAAAVPA